MRRSDGWLVFRIVTQCWGISCISMGFHVALSCIMSVFLLILHQNHVISRVLTGCWYKYIIELKPQVQLDGRLFIKCEGFLQLLASSSSWWMGCFLGKCLLATFGHLMNGWLDMMEAHAPESNIWSFFFGFEIAIIVLLVRI